MHGRTKMTQPGVLWDMDGTLIDSEPTAVKALMNAAEKAGISLPSSVEHNVIGMAADKIYEWFRRDFDLELGETEWEALKHKFYFEDAKNLLPFPGAIAAWDAFRTAGIHQAVVSNSARSIVDFNCQQIGLNQPGLVTISRDDVSRGKPDPEGYLKAAKLLRLTPSRCIVLEDSLSGLEAGRAAKMLTYCVPHSAIFSTTQADRISNLSEFVKSVTR